MKVSAINYGSNRITTFGQRQEQTQEPKTTLHTSPTNIGKAVPVMVLMAMNPALLNANIPTTEQENPNTIMVLAPTEALESSETPTYEMTLPQDRVRVRAGGSYYGWGYLKDADIIYDQPAKCNGKDWRVLYTTFYNNRAEKEINEVFLVDPNGKAGKEESSYPAQVRELIVHRAPDGNDFATVVVDECIANANGKTVDKWRREIKIDDDTAQNMIDMLANKKQWKNKTHITVEETNSTRIRSYLEFRNK